MALVASLIMQLNHKLFPTKNILDYYFRLGKVNVRRPGFEPSAGARNKFCFPKIENEGFIFL